MDYLHIETDLRVQSINVTKEIRSLLNNGYEATEQILFFKNLMEELDIIWDALIEVNRQIREIKKAIEQRDYLRDQEV